MRQLSFKRRRLPPDVIRHCIRRYARAASSFHDFEDMLAGRGLDASYESIGRRFLKFAAIIAASVLRIRPSKSDYRHLDEMVIVIQRKRRWLWNAVQTFPRAFRDDSVLCPSGEIGCRGNS